MSYIIYWTIEALFHEENTFERYDAIRNATKPSTFQLYRFLQAFCQAAPQIVLQLYIVLRENIFRNFETSKYILLNIHLKNVVGELSIENYTTMKS